MRLGILNRLHMYLFIINFQFQDPFNICVAYACSAMGRISVLTSTIHYLVNACTVLTSVCGVQ